MQNNINNVQNAEQYFELKMAGLNELLSCSEEIMSSLNQDKWEDYEPLGEKRRGIIERISALEDAHRSRFNDLLSEKQKSQINAKVALIQDFEKDVVNRIYKEREDALRGLEVKQNEKNILGAYKIGDTQVTGVYLDTKK